MTVVELGCQPRCASEPRPTPSATALIKPSLQSNWLCHSPASWQLRYAVFATDQTYRHTNTSQVTMCHSATKERLAGGAWSRWWQKLLQPTLQEAEPCLRLSALAHIGYYWITLMNQWPNSWQASQQPLQGAWQQRWYEKHQTQPSV